MDAQTTIRKRRTISENVDQNCPAYRVVQKAGGLTQFAQDFDFPTSTVFGWMAKRTDRNAVSGMIPSRTRFVQELDREVSLQSYIVWRGRQLGIEYTAEDFAPVEDF